VDYNRFLPLKSSTVVHPGASKGSSRILEANEEKGKRDAWMCECAEARVDTTWVCLGFLVKGIATPLISEYPNQDPKTFFTNV
jgi:hypothetical protein